MPEDGWKQTHLSALRVRPPWSPTDEDLAFVGAITKPVLNRTAHPTVLVLGVTPRLVHMDWPAGTEIVAVDSSPGMIASTFQPHPNLASRAICAPWSDIPIDDASMDTIVGDGSLNSLSALADYAGVFGEAARILKATGVLALRCFVRPDDVEAPEDVVTRARDGAFPTTAGFRFRLCLALARDDGSVELGRLHATFNRLVPDRDALSRITGWPRADIDRVDVDTGSKVRFTFPTQVQFAQLCAPHFHIERMEHGSYTQSEQCPTILFSRT